ncbi:MAG: hypothetical protein J0M33_03460 [Anaerolineae bacterium]|nr:hypothetical protein [Anaerolineae bacterium]
MQDSPAPLAEQRAEARLTYDIAALFNGLIWAISGLVLIVIWYGDLQQAGVHSLILCYLPTGLLWIAGLAWFLDSIDARLPAKGLIALTTAWIVGILWPLLSINREISPTGHLIFTILHLIIIGWLPIISLDVLLFAYYPIHWIMLMIVPMAWVSGGIVLMVCLSVAFLVDIFAHNVLLSLALVSFGYGIMGLMGGGVTLFAVADAKLRRSTASSSPLI